MGIEEQILFTTVVVLFQRKLKINPITNIFIAIAGAIVGNWLLVGMCIILIIIYKKE